MQLSSSYSVITMSPAPVRPRYVHVVNILKWTQIQGLYCMMVLLKYLYGVARS
jgi:hypothetical protein